MQKTIETIYLNSDRIASFKALYLKHFGVELSDVDARDAAERLLQLFRAVYFNPIFPENRQEYGSPDGDKTTHAA